MAKGIFTVDPGLTVAQSLTAFWDFTKYTGYETDNITEPIKDITGNGNDFLPQSGAIWTRSNIGVHSVSCFTPPGFINSYDFVNTVRLTAAKTQALFNGDWELFLLMQQRAGSGYVCVCDNSSHFVKIFGGLSVAIAAGGTQCSTTPTYFDTSSTGTVLLRIKRVNGVSLQLYKNGVPFTSTISGATANHSGLTLTADWNLGIYNLNGVKSGAITSRDSNYLMMGIKKGTLTNQQANDLQNYMYSKWVRKF